VGDYLEQFDDGARPVDLIVLDYCVSCAYKREAHAYVVNTPSANYSMYSSEQMTGRVLKEVYYRVPIAPAIAMDAIVLPRTDGLSVRELTLASALINSNKRVRT
jgi:hypothetical protein